jgi:hypothetical protein
MQSTDKLLVLIKRALLVGTFLFVLGAAETSAEGSDDLEKSLKSGKKEIQFSGKEKESVRIPKGVSVIGSSPEKAIIAGDISMADGSSLTNVTVNGKIIAITVDKGANVNLTNVTVTGASDAGIFAPKGGGTLTISNSRIRQNRKGIFLLSDKRLVLSGSSITNNQEEGLDMHAGTGGSITGSTFANNKEGGVEVIINGSSFTMSGNTFSGNSSSGVALQSYGGGGGGAKIGSFVITGNTFSGNGNFGIDCKNPLGTGGAFFGSSAKAADNTFGGNRKGPINGECGIRNRIAVEEGVESEELDSAESLEEELQEEEDMTILSQEIGIKRERLEALQKAVATLGEEAALYRQKKKEQSDVARLVARTPQQRLLEGRLLEKQAHLKRKIESCLPVTTYELSIEISEELFLCTEGEKKALIETLEAIASQVRTPTYKDKIIVAWRQLTERFLLRLV